MRTKLIRAPNVLVAVQKRLNKVRCFLAAILLQISLGSAPALALESVPPIFIWADTYVHNIQVPAQDVPSCIKALLQHCKENIDCQGWSPLLFSKWWIFKDPYSDSASCSYEESPGANAHFGHIMPGCASADPPYKYNTKTKMCERQGGTELRITSIQPVIPSASGVLAKKVLTRAELTLSLKTEGKVAPGKLVTLSSDRGETVDTIEPSGVVTDVAGVARTKVSTRTQPGTSTIRAKGSTIRTVSAGVIAWLPAKYEGQFVVTCYTISDEGSMPATSPMVSACGLAPEKKYRSAFLSDVKMQGTGTALDGTIIKYKGKGCYYIDTCARTATGVCASAGSTIAVDPKVIPQKSTVNLDIIGQRHAMDTGGGIKGYHIDEYVGPQPKLCKQLGRRQSGVTFQNY